MKMKTKGKKKVVIALVVVALIVIGGLMSRAYMMKKGADTSASPHTLALPKISASPLTLAL